MAGFGETRNTKHAICGKFWVKSSCFYSEIGFTPFPRRSTLFVPSSASTCLINEGKEDVVAGNDLSWSLDPTQAFNTQSGFMIFTDVLIFPSILHWIPKFPKIAERDWPKLVWRKGVNGKGDEALERIWPARETKPWARETESSLGSLEQDHWTIWLPYHSTI